MEFGSLRFHHQILYKGKIITYQISGDGRDFFVERFQDNEIDENLFPISFDIGKVNNRIRSSISNSDLKKEIEAKIQSYLDEKGIRWLSH